MLSCTILRKFKEHGSLDRMSFQACLDRLSETSSVSPGCSLKSRNTKNLRGYRCKALGDASRPTKRTYSSRPLHHNPTGHDKRTSHAGESGMKISQTQPTAGKFRAVGGPNNELNMHMTWLSSNNKLRIHRYHEKRIQSQK